MGDKKGERVYGISYMFSKVPKVEEVSAGNQIVYSPEIVCCGPEGKVISKKNDISFQVNYRNFNSSRELLGNRMTKYRELQKKARECQERIVAEYICTVIMGELRKFSDMELTFLIVDEFQTEKVVGRLGYLGLPLSKVHIMFVSRSLSDMMASLIAPYSVPLRNDLSMLLQKETKGRVLGPYPEEDVVSMLRTYYCTFADSGGQAEFYPLRINAFAQGMSKNVLNEENSRIQKLFLNPEVSEPYEIVGGKSGDMTKLPEVLILCEDYVKNARERD